MILEGRESPYIVAESTPFLKGRPKSSVVGTACRHHRSIKRPDAVPRFQRTGVATRGKREVCTACVSERSRQRESKPGSPKRSPDSTPHHITPAAIYYNTTKQIYSRTPAVNPRNVSVHVPSDYALLFGKSIRISCAERCGASSHT